MRNKPVDSKKFTALDIASQSNQFDVAHNAKLFNNQIEWLNSKEAAEYLRISESNLRTKISRGEIPVDGRLGRTLRFRRDSLDKLLCNSKHGVTQ